MALLPAANPSVIFQKLDDGAVLFDPTSEIYFGLNEVGALVWQGLTPATTTLDALCECVGAAYPEVAPDTIRADVSDLLAQLATEGLLRLPEPPGRDADAGR